MATCETSGNDYDKAFQVVMKGETHTFDSFECAIHALAPTCKHCGTRIVGHGLEQGQILLLRSLRAKKTASMNCATGSDVAHIRRRAKIRPHR